jgi:hypothetical protein
MAGGEINHSFQSGTEVRNERSCALTPAVCLHGVGRDTFPSIWMLRRIILFIVMKVTCVY